MSQTPSIGRIVHYQRYGTPGGEHKSEPSPAIITRVINAEDGIVDLTVFNPNGLHLNQHVEFHPQPTPGHWNWPPYAAPAPKPVTEVKPIRPTTSAPPTLNQLAEIIRVQHLNDMTPHQMANEILELFGE